MEINWAERQLQRYAEEARSICHRLAVGETNDFFVVCALRFTHSFLNTPPEMPGFAESLLVVADLVSFLYLHLHRQGRWSENIYILTHLVDHLKRVQYWEFYALNATRLALTINHQQGPQAAAKLYVKVLNAPNFDELPLLQQVEIWHQYSICLIDLGDYARATSYLQSAIKLCEQNQAAGAAPKVMNRPDILTHVPGKFWQHHGFMLNLMGNIALMFGRYPQAQRYYEQSARVFAKHDANEEFAYSANQSLGRLWLYRQEYAKALPYLLRNYELSHRHAKVQGNAASSCYLAAAYIGLNQLEMAEDLLNSAIRMFNQLQDKSDMAMCHLYFGELESARGNHEAAVAQWQRVLELLRSTQSHMIEQQALTNLMLHHLRAGQITNSLDAFALLMQSLRRQGIEPYGACAAALPPYCTTATFTAWSGHGLQSGA